MKQVVGLTWSNFEFVHLEQRHGCIRLVTRKVDFKGLTGKQQESRQLPMSRAYWILQADKFHFEDQRRPVEALTLMLIKTMQHCDGRRILCTCILEYIADCSYVDFGGRFATCSLCNQS